ncbi:MAG: VanW family protein [Peptococcaceae bacterium]|nr:VanW family protein [Peptococcaceae bacterium]
MSDLKGLVKIFVVAFLFGMFVCVWVSRIDRPVQGAWAWQANAGTETGEVESREEKVIEVVADGKQFRFTPSKKNDKIDSFTWRYSFPADNGTLREMAVLLNKNIDGKLTDKGIVLLTLALKDGLPVKLELPTKILMAESWMPVYSDPGSVNMLLAAKAIDGTVVPPGGEFSFNRIVGPRTGERGYVESISIYGNERVPDVGGGVCRTATLLHAAVLKAGLKVAERKSHSLPVSYSLPGEDAAVAWGALDYRFVNNLERPLKVSINREGSEPPPARGRRLPGSQADALPK